MNHESRHFIIVNSFLYFDYSIKYFFKLNHGVFNELDPALSLLDCFYRYDMFWDLADNVFR